MNIPIMAFSGGDPIWEYMSHNVIELEDASEDDLANLLYWIDAQIECDDKLMDRCQGW